MTDCQRDCDFIQTVFKIDQILHEYHATPMTMVDCIDKIEDLIGKVI